MQRQPPTIDDLITARRRDIADCRTLRGAATLRHLAGDANAQREIDAPEDEIAQHERTIARLEDAKTAQAVEHTEERLDERRRTVKTAKKDVARLDTEIERVAAAIVERLEGIAPLVAQINAAMEDRERALAAALRAGGQFHGPFGVTNAMTCLRTDSAINMVVTDALASTGLGRNHMRLHNVQIPEVSSARAAERENQREKVRQRVAAALDAALAAIDSKED